jgi:hypothetical protein
MVSFYDTSERLDWQPRLFGGGNQIGKEQMRRSGRRFGTFVYVQMAGQRKEVWLRRLQTLTLASWQSCTLESARLKRAAY